MEVKVLYFGMIEEKTGKSSEVISIKESINLKELKSEIIKSYPSLQDLVFRMSLNKNIVDENEIVTENSEVALLPPFAGG